MKVAGQEKTDTKFDIVNDAGPRLQFHVKPQMKI